MGWRGGRTGQGQREAPLPGVQVRTSPEEAAPSTWRVSSSFSSFTRGQQPRPGSEEGGVSRPGGGAEVPAGTGPRASTGASSPAGPALSAAGAAPGPSRLPAPSHTGEPREDRRAAKRERGGGGRRRGDSSCGAEEPDSSHHHIKEAAIFPRPTMHRATGRRVGQAGPPPSSRGYHGDSAASPGPSAGRETPGAFPERPPPRGSHREPQGLKQATLPRAGGDHPGEGPPLARSFPRRARPQDVGGGQPVPGAGGGHHSLGRFGAACGKNAFQGQDRHRRGSQPEKLLGSDRRTRG